MINIYEVSPPNKLSGLSSLVIKFDYNEYIVDALKTLPTYNYDKKNNVIEITEIPYSTTAEVIIDKIIEQIKAGKIPQYSTITRTQPSANKYIMAKKGDKMTEIAKRYNMNAKQLKELNPEITSNTIKKETKIRIK